MGAEADDILPTFSLSEDDQNDYDTVKQKFNDYFSVRRNVIFERAKFNQRGQREGEPVDSFITDLYSLAENCNYGALHDEMIRDRIVVGIRDMRLSEKLQHDSNLTLQSAVTHVRQSEIIHKQQPVIRGSSSKPDVTSNSNVEEVLTPSAKSKKVHHKSKSKKSRPFMDHSKPKPSCTYCGKPSHPRRMCPASNSTCRKCGKTGHWDVVCRSSKSRLSEVRSTQKSTTSNEPEYAFVGMLSTSSSQPWTVNLKINSSVTEEFKIDTGADVTVIPYDVYTSHSLPRLRKSDKRLYGPSNSSLSVVGKFRTTLQSLSRDVQTEQDIYVARGLTHSLLGRPAIEGLHLIKRVDSVTGDKWKELFPELFSGLGKMEGEYSIKLKENAQPFAISTPRRVPLPLMDKVKHELQNMEDNGVISKVLYRLLDAGVTLNREKCQFYKSQVKFLGHIIDRNGIRADPDKIRAIVNMAEPQNVSDIRRLLGMVNQLAKFVPNLASITQPLRELLVKDREWIWDEPQQTALQSIKSQLTSAPVLGHYDSNAETVLSADASSFGLGAVISQKCENGVYKPIAYCSRSMTETEKRYAQEEKEALAITWSCERFRDYLLGKHFHINTDHKPLLALLGDKSLDQLPPRIQRFRMRLMAYSYDISHVPGKQLCSADALSRAPLESPLSCVDSRLLADTNIYVNSVLANLPASDQRLDEIRLKLRQDPVCSLIMKYCLEGWPTYTSLPNCTRSYWPYQGELSVVEGLLLFGKRLVIPSCMRAEMLEIIHSTHQGITKCRARAKESVWWPGLSSQIEQVVMSCRTCALSRPNSPEPLIPSETPTRPWSKVSTDLFEIHSTPYLLVIDNYSKYIEIAKLTSTTSACVVNHLKSIFGRHGIPDIVVSDNGPQYSSYIFKKFSEEYCFTHITSSPRYPQSNGEAERAVKTVKQTLKKVTDPYLALLTYRSTPLQCGYSPAQLLMGRNLRTTLPVHPSQLQPQLPSSQEVEASFSQAKKQQKSNFDSRHRSRNLPPVKEGDKVLVRDPEASREGEVYKKADTPRSYYVKSGDNILRRNRKHLVLLPPQQQSTPKDSEQLQFPVSTPLQTSSDIPPNSTVTRSGRVSTKPNRLDL